MNHNDLPNDELLQFVCGELDEAHQAAVRKAIAEDAELAAVAQALSAAVAVVRAEHVGQVSDEFNDRLRQRMSEVFEPEQAETTRPTFLTRSRTTWRWIMRHPISRVAAAAIFVLAILGVALWFHAGGTTPAFADFIEPILNAKTVKYKMTAQMTAPSPELKLLPAKMQKDLSKGAGSIEVMMITTPDGYRARKESENMDGSKTVEITISEVRQGKEITLQPAKKQATVRNVTNMPKDKKPKRDDTQKFVTHFRSLLLDARDKPGIKRESLGEKEIDGRRVVGFRLSGYGLAGAAYDSVMILWGDPKTGLPVRIETTMATTPNVKVTMSDFAFDVDMDESLFSVEPPSGYEVIQGPPIDASPLDEKDLIATFRDYSELSGGPFPALLDSGSLSRTATRLKWNSLYREKPQEPQAERQQELDAAMARLQRGLWFTMRLPKEADSHYAGKGVSFGAADNPIFWYRPIGAKKYRVIYADLSVRDAGTPPNAPVAKPDTEPEEKDLIETLRDYSKLSGGPFPNALDIVSVTPMAEAKGSSPQHSAKEELEILEAQAKLMRGLTFVVSLPPEADAHYAGRGVSLGAADTPIFWYRPRDGKKYRVIYADLSIRETDTPPSAPVVQPEQDLIDTLRYYSELSGGPFPAKLDMTRLAQLVMIKKFPPEDEHMKAPGQWLDAKQIQKFTNILMLKVQPGFTFIASLPPDADAHYAGKGVSLGAADTPIYWYRPADSKTYRVIYGDLLVRGVDTPPSAPVVQPEQDLIDTFRYYSQLSGGPFPDSLEPATLSQFLEKKWHLEKGQKLNAKQLLEIMEYNRKIEPGSTFLASLPPAADAHYAGKGVSLGAADTPIFWYRPKDSKKYRVTYADLSVREADTPPNVPKAQPVPSQSSSKK